MVDVSLDTQQNLPHVAHPISLKKIAIVGSIGTGIQFGWALQFSLLTPYLQLLGIPHKWTSFIWLCGPISGLIVQPIVGYQSDKCSSRWGRRRPFIAGGCFFVLVAIVLISFAVDFGRSLGDPLSSKVKLKAIAVFVAGFWIFDVANNTLQGPVRAFLADLAGNDQQRTRNVFAMYSFFLAVGSVLGYAAGSFGNLYKFLPFTKTLACDTDCANLKTCFFISIFLLLTFTVFALIFVQDKPVARRSSGPTTEEDVEMVESTAGASDTKTKELAELAGNPNGNSTVNKEEKIIPFKSKGEVLKALQAIPRPIWIIVFITILNWMALCPFVLYDTDWMGKEVYGGTVGEGTRYASGVRAGALGLVLNSVVFGCTSLGIEFLIRNLGGVKRLWGCANFFLALCLGCTVLITKLAESSRNGSGNENHAPSLGIRLSALALFAALGVPLGVAYSIPFALASIFTNSSGGGQGLTVGVLNLGIVIPQLIVSLTSGPWDELFGGGNLPYFIVGIFFAAASGIVVLTLLPSPPRELPMSSPKKTGSS